QVAAAVDVSAPHDADPKAVCRVVALRDEIAGRLRHVVWRRRAERVVLCVRAIALPVGLVAGGYDDSLDRPRLPAARLEHVVRPADVGLKGQERSVESDS